MAIQHKLPANLYDRGFTERNPRGVLYHNYLARWEPEPAWRYWAKRLQVRYRAARRLVRRVFVPAVVLR